MSNDTLSVPSRLCLLDDAYIENHPAVLMIINVAFTCAVLIVVVVIAMRIHGGRNILIPRSYDMNRIQLWVPSAPSEEQQSQEEMKQQALLRENVRSLSRKIDNLVGVVTGPAYGRTVNRGRSDQSTNLLAGNSSSSKKKKLQTDEDIGVSDGEESTFHECGRHQVSSNGFVPDRRNESIAQKVIDELKKDERHDDPDSL